MRIVPRDLTGQLEFARVHLPMWKEAEVEIGVTKDELDELTGLLADAEAAAFAAEQARQAALAATTLYHARMQALRGRTAGLIGKIKAHASLQTPSGGRQVYAAAGLPLPGGGVDAPRPLRQAPGAPQNVKIAPQSDGSVKLSWTGERSAMSAAAVFAITRKLIGMDGQAVGGAGGAGGPGGASRTHDGYEFIGYAPGTTRRARRATFVDASVPRGVASARYIITPQRGRDVGEPSLAVSVEFGSGPAAGAGAGVMRVAA